MKPEIRDTVIYRVQDGSPLVLRVKSGYRQPAGTSLMIGAREWSPPSDVLEREGEVLADDGADLRSRSVHCRTTVQDRRPEHNRTSVLYTMSGGADGPKEFAYKLEASVDFGPAYYVIEIVFI